MSMKESLLQHSAKDYGATNGVDYGEMRSICLNGSSFVKHDCPDLTMQDKPIQFSNTVVTSKYTLLTFFPKNIWEQFSNVANLYFLAIGVLQLFPQITTTDGIPTMYESLSFIILVGMLRAGSEDWAKHKTDRIRNRAPYWVLDSSAESQGDDFQGFVQKRSGDLRPGHILKIHKDQMIPCDGILLGSSLDRGNCFIDKANLNGETKLEVLYSLEDTRPYCKSVDDLENLNIRLFYEKPSGSFDSFKSFLELNPNTDFQSSNQARYDSSHIPIGIDRLLLRETNLRNTDYIYILVVYTGDDTRIQMSNNESDNSALKKTKIMRYVDAFLIQMLVFQTILCLIGGIYCAIWTAYEYNDWYLVFDDHPFWAGFEAFFTWYILLCQMVPIALIVSAEMVKFIASTFVEWDHTLFYEKINKPIKCNSSVIHEELGFVDYIFSDKTGTLTQNKMEFRYALLPTREYGSADTEISRTVENRMNELAQKRAGGLGIEVKPWTKRVKRYTSKTDTYTPDCLDSQTWWTEKSTIEDDEDEDEMNVNSEFSEEERNELLSVLWGETTSTEEKETLRTYMTHMALSNTVTPYIFENELKFQCESAEEAAMVEFARSLGFTKLSVNPTVLQIKNLFDEKKNFEEKLEYKHIATFGFTSARARVTVIYKDMQSNKIHIMLKGQDTVVLPLLNELEDEHNILSKLKNANAKGARTLMCGYSILPLEWWSKHEEKYTNLSQDDSDHGKQKLNKYMSEIELDAKIKYLGCLGFEDQLQELVPDVIRDCLRAGIKVWMITGDKLETAKNIGLACNLIDPDMLSQVPEDDSNVERVLQASRESRLFEITGQWANLSKDTQQLSVLFDMFDSNNDGVLSLDELNVYLSALQFSIDSNALKEKLNKITSLNETKQISSSSSPSISKDDFIVLMRSTRLTPYDAVKYDIKDAIQRYCSIIDHDLNPVSILITREAFNVMFPQPGDKVTATEEQLEILRKEFFSLAFASKSVVFARAQPAMKRRMVTEIMQRDKTAITLAIGDGANDTDMIMAAHVGVGIAGIEGTAASSSADYAFGTFRLLHTLLFVHGFWSSHRISILVNFIFYKACLLALTQYYIGFASGFSGQQFFDDPIYQLYNLIFTAAPIMVIGVLERPLPREVLENNPSVYSENKLVVFRRMSFYGWIIRAILHSLIIYIIPFQAYGMSGVAFSNGKTEGFYFMSTISYFAVALLPNFLILYEMRSITVIHHISIIGSILCIFLFVWIYNLFVEYDSALYGVVDRIYSCAYAFFVILLTTAVPLLIEHGYRSITARFFPTYTQVLQEKLKLFHKVHNLESTGDVHLLSKHESATKVVQTLQDEKEWQDYKRSLPSLPSLGKSKQKDDLQATTTKDEENENFTNAILRSILHVRHLNSHSDDIPDRKTYQAPKTKKRQSEAKANIVL